MLQPVKALVRGLRRHDPLGLGIRRFPLLQCCTAKKLFQCDSVIIMAISIIQLFSARLCVSLVQLFVLSACVAFLVCFRATFSRRRVGGRAAAEDHLHTQHQGSRRPIAKTLGKNPIFQQQNSGGGDRDRNWVRGCPSCRGNNRPLARSMAQLAEVHVLNKRWKILRVHGSQCPEGAKGEEVGQRRLDYSK